MVARTLKLNENWISRILSIPEKGMGYHLVKIILKNGQLLRRHKIINSSVLLLEEHECISLDDIEQILPE
jgi:hypothetical protein